MPFAPRPFRRAASFLAVAGGLLLLGCGPSEPRVSVRGTLTEGGAPLQVEGRDLGLGMVQLQFFRIGDSGEQEVDPYSTVAGEDGAFVLAGHEGRGIPPGRYRIAVYQWDPYPQFDRLEGRFSEENSPLIRVIEEEVDLQLDLARPEE